MTTPEAYKGKIIDKYIKDFKSELNFFERLMVLPIENKMKEILKSNQKINVDKLDDLTDLGFRRKILGVQIGDKKLFNNLVNKIFSFLKEKQENIIKAETEGKLEELANLVIDGKLGELESSIQNPSQTNPGEDDEANSGEEEEASSSEGGENNSEESGEHDSGEASQSNDSGSAEVNPENSDVADNSEASENNQNYLKEHPVAAGLGAGVVAGGLQIGAVEAIERVSGLTGAREIKDFDGNQTKELLTNVNEKLTEQLKNPKLNTSMKKTYEKTIKNFDDTIKSLDAEGIEAFKDFQKLSNKLPSNILNTMNIDRKVLIAIDKLTDEELSEFVKIIKSENKSVEEIEENMIQFFKAKNIEITKDLAKQLRVADNIEEIRGVINIFKNSTKLSKIAKGIKGMGVLTFLLAGVDVRCYFETMKEADIVNKLNSVRGEVMKNEAATQLWIGLGSVIAELASIVAICTTGGSVVGPIGTAVGIAIGVLAAGLSIGADALYFDKKNFYSQNRYDFITQSRTQLKQSIVQLLESDRLNMNESMKLSIKDERGENSEIDTQEDAREALIYQEEIVNGGYYTLQSFYNSRESEDVFLSKLSDSEKQQYNREKQQMEDKIRIRMDYIKKYIKKDSELYPLMKESIEKNQGVSFVEQVLADSNVYRYLQSEDDMPYIENYKDLGVEEYKNAYKEKLSKEYPNEFEIFEKLKQENPVKLKEICLGVEISKTSITDGIEAGYYEDCKEKIQHNMDFILKYNEYLKLGLSIEKEIQVYGMDNSMDYNYIEQVLKDLSLIGKRPLWDQETAYKYLTHEQYRERQELKYEVSEDINQNILYRLAKEFHGYTGRNDLLELIQFYNEGEGSNTGIYYDSKRKINRDRERDMPIDFSDIENILDKKDWSWSAFLFVPSYRKGIDRMDLDSPIEAADERLMEEYKNKLKQIIQEEKLYKENKNEIEEEIIGYIKEQCGDSEGYIELPYDVIIKAKKAGIGSVENYVFSFKGGKIVALCPGDKKENLLHFDSCKDVVYENIEPLRDNLTEEESDLIKSVDFIHSKLEELRSVEGDLTNVVRNSHIDELNIPIALEREISRKWKERIDIKESIRYLQPASSHDYLSAKSKEYHDFFDGLYRGILTTISNYSHTNDINDAPDFFRSYYRTSEFPIVNVQGENISIVPQVNKGIAEILPELLDYYKDESGKTVSEILKSEGDQEYGQELARQIYTICLEKTIFSYKKGAIEDFNVDIDEVKPAKLEQIKSKLATEMGKNNFYKSWNNHSNMSLDKIKIKEIHTREARKVEQDIQNDTQELTEKIVETLKRVDWEGKRGDIKFVYEKYDEEKGEISGYIESWGRQEKVIIKEKENGEKISSIKIPGLHMTFSDVDQGLRIANLINWIKDYKNKNPKGGNVGGRLGIKSKFGDFIWYNGKLQRKIINGIDIDILDESTVDKYYSNIKDENRFLGYINGL